VLNELNISVKQIWYVFEFDFCIESFSDFLLIVERDICCPNVGNAFSSSRAYGADSIIIDWSVNEGIDSSFILFLRFKRRCCCFVWIKPSSLLSFILILFSIIGESLFVNDCERCWSSWEFVLEARFGDFFFVWKFDFLLLDNFRSLFDDNLLLNERLRSDRGSWDGGTECGEVERGRCADTIAFQDDVGL
jgi:hypothetical protein